VGSCPVSLLTGNDTGIGSGVRNTPDEFTLLPQEAERTAPGLCFTAVGSPPPEERLVSSQDRAGSAVRLVSTVSWRRVPPPEPAG
jgi:hypothetical protein